MNTAALLCIQLLRLSFPFTLFNKDLPLLEETHKILHSFLVGV